MHANLQIVLILTIGFALASLFALLAQRLRLPAILGYLFAGYVIGPYSPGFVADIALAEQLAEIGVVLMLFGVGMHFRIEDLLHVKNIAVPGALIQTLATAAIGLLLLVHLGWSMESGLIMGLAIGVASTVVLIRVLTDNNILNTVKGHIAVGWLIVEDIFTVIILLLLPAIAAYSSGGNISFLNITGPLLLIIGKFALLAYVLLKWGHKIVELLLTNIARQRSQELFTLTVLGIVFVIATVSAVLIGTSIALGAFIAGMVIAKTRVRHQASANALPLKDIFTVLFFISVGMLFDPDAIASHFLVFAEILGVILLVKPLVALLITLTLGYSLNTALTLAVALAQIGEFSFILAEEATNLQLLPDEGFDIIVACAIVSISLNPLLFPLINRIERVIASLPFLRHSQRRVEKEQKVFFFPKVIIIGFGTIGREVYSCLKSIGIQPLIVEQNIDTVAKLEMDEPIYFGDAADSDILSDIHIEEASHLLITLPDTSNSIKIVNRAKSANPDIQILCRTQYIADEEALKELHVQNICQESETMKAYLAEVRRLFRKFSLIEESHFQIK